MLSSNSLPSLSQTLSFTPFFSLSPLSLFLSLSISLSLYLSFSLSPLSPLSPLSFSLSPLSPLSLSLFAKGGSKINQSFYKGYRPISKMEMNRRCFCPFSLSLFLTISLYYCLSFCLLLYMYTFSYCIIVMLSQSV